jgi:hypothetical protein
MTLRGGVITVWRFRWLRRGLQRFAGSDYSRSAAILNMTLTEEQIAEAGEQSRAQSLRQRLSRRFPRAGTMLILGVLIVVLNGLHVRSYDEVSPFDEVLHVDQMARYSRFEFVQTDDGISQEAMRDIACELDVGMPCKDGRYDGDDFSYKGWNTASSAPPYYYFVTGVTARILSAPAGNSIINWGRILGSLWLLVGVYFVIRAAEYFAAPRLSLLLGVIMVVATPPLLHASNTINSDTTAFVSGAAVLLAGLAWERRRAPLWLLGVAAAFCASFDSTNALGVVVVLLYFLVRAVASHRRQVMEAVRPWRQYLVAGVVAAVSAAVAVLSWRVVYELVSHDVDLSQTDQVRAFKIDHLDLRMLLGKKTLFAAFPPPGIDYVPQILNTTAYSLFAQAALILIGGLLIAAAIRTVGDRLSALGVATVAALILTPVLFVIYNFVSASQYFPILPRNALTALPAVVVVVAAVARTRFAIALLGIVAVGLYLSAAVPLL